MLNSAIRNPQFAILLRNASRWSFLAALVYAPWAYGCTTSATITGLNWTLAAALALWAAGLLVREFAVIGDRRAAGDRRAENRLADTGASDVVSRRSWPRTVLAFATVLLLLLGWWMVWNAHAIYDSAFYLAAQRAAPFARLAGSVDQAISAAWMVRATLLLGVIWLVADLSRNPVWLLRVWWTIALTGGSIALLGLVQKAIGAETIFWGEASPAPVKTFFATYFYHANAGAYLNLVLPLAIGLTVRCLTTPTAAVLKALALSVALVTLGATAANTSRMAQVIALMLCVMLAVFGLRWARHSRGLSWRGLVGAVALIVLTLFAIGQASRLEYSVERWSTFSETAPKDARWLAPQAAVRALPDAGLLGFGPGTFRVVFPYYTGAFGERLGGFWRFLHQDYLQTLLEWGWIGSALWGVVFFGGVGAAVAAMRSSRRKAWRPRHRMILQLALMALTGVALHSCVDFPLQIASLQLYAATYLGLCWGSSGWS